MVQPFRLQELCLRLMAQRDDGTSKVSLKHLGLLLLVVFGELPMINNAVYHRDNMEMITESLSVSLTNLLTVIKMSTFLAYRQNFYQMMHSFRQMYPKSNTSDSNFVVRDNKLAARLGKAYCISCALTGLYFMINPIVRTIASHWTGVLYQRELPMPMTFPFEDRTSPAYELIFVYCLVATISVVAYASAVDGSFITFAINLRAHFQTLQQHIQQLNYDQQDPLVQRQLVTTIRYHIHLLELSRKLRDTYAPIVFGQFLITSLQVGLILYQILTNIDSAMMLIKNFSFFCSIMLQLFMYCYGGEMIKTESQEVAIAVQLSDWHLARPKHRRLLVFIMQRAQRLVVIKAGIYEASLANFLAIIRAASSFIALFQSID